MRGEWGEPVWDKVAARRRTHSTVKHRNGERRFGDWRKAQFAQGVMPGMLLGWGIRGGNGEERSAASGCVVNHRAEETALQRWASGLLLQ